jgi:hypothetical protein
MLQRILDGRLNEAHSTTGSAGSRPVAAAS